MIHYLYCRYFEPFWSRWQKIVSIGFESETVKGSWKRDGEHGGVTFFFCRGGLRQITGLVFGDEASMKREFFKMTPTSSDLFTVDHPP